MRSTPHTTQECYSFNDFLCLFLILSLLSCIAFVTCLLHFWFTEYQISPCCYANGTVHLLKNILGQSLISTLFNAFVCLVLFFLCGSSCLDGLLSVPLLRISSISLFLVSFQQITGIEQDSLRGYNIDIIFQHLNDFSAIFSSYFFFFFFPTALKQCVRLSGLFWAFLYPFYPFYILTVCIPSLNCSTSLSHMNLILQVCLKLFLVEHTDPIHFYDMKWAW